MGQAAICALLHWMQSLWQHTLLKQSNSGMGLCPAQFLPPPHQLPFLLFIGKALHSALILFASFLLIPTILSVQQCSNLSTLNAGDIFRLSQKHFKRLLLSDPRYCLCTLHDLLQFTCDLPRLRFLPSDLRLHLHANRRATSFKACCKQKSLSQCGSHDYSMPSALIVQGEPLIQQGMGFARRSNLFYLTF